MTIILANNVPVLSGALTADTVGAWFADITVGAIDATDGDTVTLTDGANYWVGSVVSGGLFESRAMLRIVGGSGGLREPINPRHYKAAKVGQVLSDICSTVGETADPAIDRSVSSTILPFWSRYQQTAGRSVAELADAAGVAWRVLPSGKVWLGSADETYQAPADALVLNHDPASGTYTIAPESIAYTPGMTQSAGTISRIEYSLGNSLRATYWVR